MRFVVAGALVRTRTSDPAGCRELLLAQRSYPPELAGLWELPGGKVAPGESHEAALQRELIEELAVRVDVGHRLAATVPLRDDLQLVAYWAEPRGGEPRAVEHRALTWVDADQLAELVARGAMVPADVAWVPELVSGLRASD